MQLLKMTAVSEGNLPRDVRQIALAWRKVQFVESKRVFVHVSNNFDREKNMDHESLRLFLHLCRSQQFAITSRECRLSPSSLTRCIQKMEEELGCKLFVRGRRQIQLTSSGAKFREYAQESLVLWDQIQHQIHNRGGELSGTLSIFASVTACYSVLPQLLDRFRSSHPQVHIQLETGDAANALNMLRQRAVDLTVAAISGNLPKSIASSPLTYTPIVFVAPTSAGTLSRLYGRDAVDWQRVPLILPKRGLARTLVNRWYKSQGLRPKIYAEVAGAEGLLSLVTLGCGIGVVPRLVFEKSPLRSALQILDVHPELGGMQVAMCTRRDSLEVPVVEAFWSTLVGYTQGPSGVF